MTATITSSFVARRQREMSDDAGDPVLGEFKRLHERLEGIEAQLHRIDPRSDAPSA